MITIKQGADESRLEMLVRVLEVFIDTNGVGWTDYEKVIWDEAESDLFCLLEDIKIEVGG